MRILSPPRSSLTVENVHGDGDGLRVGGAAGVLAAVRRLDGGDEQRRGGARRGLHAAAAAAGAAVRRRRRQHGDPAARRRVVDGLEGKGEDDPIVGTRVTTCSFSFDLILSQSNEIQSRAKKWPQVVRILLSN